MGPGSKNCAYNVVLIYMLLRKTKENTGKTIQDGICLLFYLLFMLLKHSFPAPENYKNKNVKEFIKNIVQKIRVSSLWTHFADTSTVQFFYNIFWCKTLQLRKIRWRIPLKYWMILFTQTLRHKHTLFLCFSYTYKSCLMRVSLL